MLQQALALSLEESQLLENKEPETGVDVALTVEVNEQVVHSQQCVEQRNTTDPMLVPDDDAMSHQQDLPPPYPYLSLLNNSLPKGNLKEAVATYKGLAVNDSSHFFDSNSAQYFAALPSEHIMVHLLRCASNMIEQSKPTAKSEVSKGPCVGGVGSTVFKNESKTEKSREETDDCDPNVVQLLIVLLVFFSDARTQVLEKLNHIKADEDARGKSDKEPRVELTSRDDDESFLLEEEDDPARQILLIEEKQKADQCISYELLEEKGLHRKAAAAADSALMREQQRNRGFTLKKSAFIFSKAAYYTMTCLINILSNKRNEVALPPSLIRMLGNSLESFYDYKKTLISASLSNEEDGRLLLLVPLCHLSIMTYSTCMDIFHPCHEDRERTLMTLIQTSLSLHKENRNTSDQAFICTPLEDTITEFPWTYTSQVSSMIDIICRSLLSVSSRLDSFVPHPSSMEQSSGKPQKSPVSILHQIGSAVAGSNNNYRPLPASNSLTKLYMALSYRVHTNLFLWGTRGIDSTFDENCPTLYDSSLRLNSMSQLVFDQTKCADSIALSKHNAHQRASKTWGTVLSTIGFSPKTGVHSWAVQLDKCEKGHVFVGVTTSQASTRTYVGGDKYGWGVIGTQALWHERSKVSYKPS